MEPTPSRPWYEFDGKLVLAGLFVLGYYGLIYRISGNHPLPPANAQLIRDALLVLGPPLGAIFNALYRTTGAEERQSERRSQEIQTAIATPTVAAAPVVPQEVTAEAVRSGAEDGARAGVADGMADAAAEAHPADAIAAGAPLASWEKN